MATPQKAKSALEQNRDFFEQFFTKVVKTYFGKMVLESPERHMNIIVGLCTSASAQLIANGNKLALMAGQMASTNPEIHITFTSPEANKTPLNKTIIYQPPNGWMSSDGSEKMGDLTTWLERTTTEFLTWSSTLNTT